MKEDKLKKANAILKKLKETLNSFSEIYDSLKNDEQKQNILRAKLLFSCSGVDSIVKQLILDTLEEIISLDEGALNQLKKYAERKLGEKDGKNTKLISELFVCENPKKTLISMLKEDLTRNSLQSSEELLKVAAMFNIETSKIEDNVDYLKKIFYIRNQITHEMDVDMSSEEFILRYREKDDFDKYSEHMVSLITKFIDSIKDKLENNDKIEETINLGSEDDIYVSI